MLQKLKIWHSPTGRSDRCVPERVAAAFDLIRLSDKLTLLDLSQRSD